MSAMTNAFDRKRLLLLNIDDQVRRLLPEVWTLVEPNLPTMLDAFYAHLATIPSLSDLVEDPRNVSRLKSVQLDHWKSLFSGQFDQSYFECVTRIGRTHQKIGLEPRWYLAGYVFFLARVLPLLISGNRGSRDSSIDMIQTVAKAIFLDMDLVNSVYYNAMKEGAEQTLTGYADGIEKNVQGLVEPCCICRDGTPCIVGNPLMHDRR